MDTTFLYSQILGINSPWLVNDVNLDINSNKVEVFVSYKGESGNCQCGSPFHFHGNNSERRWRHLDTCQLVTLIICSLPRLKCSSCGKTETLQGSWCSPNSRFTLLFENMVINWLLVSQSQTGVAKSFNLSFDEVNGIMSRALDRGLANREQEVIEYLSIDEKSMKKGHKYLTVLSNPKTGTVLDVCKDRTKLAVTSLLEETLSFKQRRSIKAISMDMWDAFIYSSKLMLPIADIVHDRFHISKLLNNAVDITRRQEVARLSKIGNYDLKRSKYLWLMNFSSMNDSKSIRFAKASQASKSTAEVWVHKEAFRYFFECESYSEAEEFLSSWFESAKDKPFFALRRVAKTLMKYSQGILNYTKYKFTNALAESINGKIQLLKAKARGFLTFNNYRRNILFYFGGLKLSHTNS